MSRWQRKLNKDVRKSKKGKRHGVLHHIVPKSRGGITKDWNMYKWNLDEHRAWHYLFVNLLPSEVIDLIKKWIRSDGLLDVVKIGKTKLEKFEKTFGHENPLEAIKFIEENFLPAELRFLEEKEE